jgi:hypothetical protein
MDEEVRVRQLPPREDVYVRAYPKMVALHAVYAACVEQQTRARDAEGATLMYGEGNDYRTRCGAFVTATGQQCTLDSDHDGAHEFVSEQRPTPERLAHIRANVALWLKMLHPTEAIVTASELLAELEAVTAERDAEKERAAWSIRTADTRWRQLDAVRERVSVQLLSIDTLARNIAEYPDRIPLLIETIESLYERVQDGSIASLPTTTTTTAARPPEGQPEADTEKG